VRARAASIGWVGVAIVLPWVWYLVRDLGPAMQFVSMALPVLVAAALLGLLISAADSRKIAPLFVAASVAIFGWVTVLGPRSAQPSPIPTDPIRIATLSIGDPKDMAAGLRTLEATRADVRVVVAQSKKAASAVRREVDAANVLQSGRFLVLSRYPLGQAALPKGLPSDLLIRVQVFGPTSTFDVYAARTDGGVLAAGANDPLSLERLRTVALHDEFPTILIGDLGMDDRSAEYRAYAASFRDAMTARTSASSTVGSFWSALLLRVDHVFTSTSWCAAGGRTFDVPGSDHRGLIVSVGPCKG
jgi:endonuclease/exonuclease/phosphatase family protein